MFELMIPVLYGLSDYIVLQMQAMMALCVSTDFEMRDKKRFKRGTLLYWTLCTCFMLAVGILDYCQKLYVIWLVRMIMVWVFAVVWKLIFLKEPLRNTIFSIFYASIIFLAGHAFCNILDTICLASGFGSLPWLRANDNTVLIFSLIAVRRFLLYSFIWCVIIFTLRRLLGQRWSSIVNKTVNALYAFIAVITGIFFWIEMMVPDSSFTYYMMLYCCELAYSILCIIIIVVLELKIREEKRRTQLEMNLDLTQRLWQLDKKQYEFIKDNIDIINIKCHDMRHYINRHAVGSAAVRQEVQSLSDTISAYDNMIRTGNPVCDIILSDKSMECMSKGINLNCIVDGAALEFMDEVSLYSLLGNALDNAINYVERFGDPDKRFISLNVSRKDAMVVINVENLLEGELAFEDGLPVTDKKDKHYHGFGMKSMRSTAEKYGGAMEVSSDEGIFRLVIVIPYSEKE